MVALPTVCVVCERDFGDPKAGYGDCDEPVCSECHHEMLSEQAEDWYGVAPHVHDLSRTGTFLGSTELLKLPDPDANGWIDLTPLGGWYVGTWFKPDEEGPGCGVYSRDATRVALGAAA